jgi:hypothetical protein
VRGRERIGKGEGRQREKKREGEEESVYNNVRKV